MRKFRIGLILCAMASTVLAQPASQPATQPAEASLRVFGVRINRQQSPELQKQFRNRVYSDGQVGVQMQLMLSTVDEQLPPGREAVTIETFVDDTYQSLLNPPRENGYFPQPNQPVVSEDGHALLFTVQAPRGPADEADRVFVRGNVQTRVARGKSKIESADLKVAAGATADVGPFRCTVSNINDNGRTTVNVNLAIEGDTSLVRRVRVLSTTGRVLQDVNDNGGWNTNENRSNNLNLSVPAGNEVVKLEFAVAEKVETVKIPFEAQVDCGSTKAGPMEVIQSPTTVRPRTPRSRVWPPPAQGRVELPPTRLPMGLPMAATRPRDVKAAVDVFSLTIGKPAPDEALTVKWANPPAAMFRAAGFTTLRLMVSTPDVTLIALPYDGIKITKFEDDTGAKLDTTTYVGSGEEYDRLAPMQVSLEGNQAVMPVYLAATPSSGATRCTIGGTFRAKAGRNPQSVTSSEFALQRGEKTTVGPYTVTVQQIRRTQPALPSPGFSRQDQPANVVLQIEGPLEKLKELFLLDSSDKLQQAKTMPLPEDHASKTRTTAILPVREPMGANAKVRLTYHDGVEEVNLPFEVTTGIGL